MRISKRDAQLLILLAIVLVIAGFYWFFFLPQEEALKALKDEQSVLNQQITLLDRRFAIEGTLNSDIEKAMIQLQKAGEKYYSQLYQEVLMMTIEELFNGSGILVKGVTFTEQMAQLSQLMESAKATIGSDPFASVNQTTGETVSEEPTPEATNQASGTKATPAEQLASTEVNAITAQIQFSGYYNELEIFLFNVYQYPKHIILQSLSITNDKEGLLTGNITLEFYGIPKIGVASSAIQEYFKTPSQRASIADVYLPYATYIFPPKDEVLVDSDTGFIDDSFGKLPLDGETPGDDKETPGDTIPEVPVEVKPPSELITSFEAMDYFFTGNKKSIQGSGALSTKRTEGNYGLLVQYNFIEPNLTNTANIVFDEKNLLVNKVGRALSINVYSEGPLKHRVAAELVDVSGKTYDVTFTPGHEGGGWKNFEVPVPEVISYPYVIRRIFFEGIGIDQQLVADVVIDELRLMLPDLGGSK